MSEDKSSESATPVWKCELPEVKPETAWTVGGKQLLSCRGDYVDLLASPLKIEVADASAPAKQPGAEIEPIPAKEDPYKNYKLKILSEKSVGNEQLDVVVTSYRAGKHSNLKFKIIGNEGREIQVDPINFQVASVVTEKNKSGFGPTQPIELAYPVWYWIGIGAFLFFIVLALIAKVYFLIRWKKIQAEMKSYSSSLGPANQYYKEVRALKHKYNPTALKPLTAAEQNEFWLDFEKTFKIFLINQFQIPALRWNQKKIVREISEKLSGRFKFRLTSHLKRILSEFEKSTSLKGRQTTEEDFEQMIKTCQSYVELVKKVSKIQGAV